MTQIRIGLFALKDHVGCSSFAVHIANYLSAGDSSVAVIEPESTIEPKYSTANVDFEADGTFMFNNIHYYPKGTDVNPTEDILIYDFGKVTIFHKFTNDFDKLYLCTYGSDSDYSDIVDYMNESKVDCELILVGASKNQISLYREKGFSCIGVSDKKEMSCPYDLALRVSLLLRACGVVAPEHHKDWTYDELTFGKTPEPEKKGSKGGFFGGLFGKKKTESKPKKDKKDKEIPEIPAAPVVEVAKEEIIREANEFKEPEQIKVPVPVPMPQPDKKKKKEQPKKIEETPVPTPTPTPTPAPAPVVSEEEIQKKMQEELERRLEEEEAKAKEQLQKELDQKFSQKEAEATEELQQKINQKMAEEKMKADAQLKKELAEKKRLEEEKLQQEIENQRESAKNEYNQKLKDRLEQQEADHAAQLEEERKARQAQLDAEIEAEKQKRQSELEAELDSEIKEKRQQAVAKLNRELETTKEEKSAKIEKELEEHKNKGLKKIESKQKQLEKRIQSKEKSLNKAERQENKPKKPGFLSGLLGSGNNAKPKSNSIKRPRKDFAGHISVFVTSFRHGCGSSYTAGSIASALATKYNRSVYIDRLSHDAALPDDYLVKDIVSEEDRFEAYKNGLVVYDKGLYEDVKNNPIDNSDMLRADLNVMVVTNDDMPNIARFISEQGEKVYDWVFVFNHVLSEQKTEILEEMADYNTLILPVHNFSALPTKLQKDWESVLDYKINKF